jgi:hypothetical protein
MSKRIQTQTGRPRVLRKELAGKRLHSFGSLIPFGEGLVDSFGSGFVLAWECCAQMDSLVPSFRCHFCAILCVPFAKAGNVLVIRFLFLLVLDIYTLHSE